MFDRYIYFVSLICLWTLVQLTQSQNTTVDSPWDVIVMSQGWSPTFCLEWLQEHVGECSIISPLTWTMHGVWAGQEVDGVSTNCNDSWPLDVKEIAPIEPELDRLWKSAFRKEDRYEFWSHEWQKHGTCATILAPLNTQLKYFTQGLNWIKAHSMLNILSESGILPSNDRRYHIKHISKSITSKLNVKPEINCADINNQQFLKDIHICFNVNLELTDCARRGLHRNYKQYIVEDVTVITNCDINRKTVYPLSLGKFHEILRN